MKRGESWEKEADVFDIFNVSDTIPGTFRSITLHSTVTLSR